MIQGVIFDKDGTLFDFNATWGAWAQTMIVAEAAGDARVAGLLADALGYDMAARVFRPGSIVIAETADVVADAILGVLPAQDKSALLARMDAAASQVPVTDLDRCFQTLQDMGVRLGVATNDTQASAIAHLTQADVLQHFSFVAGSDSGYGGKPAAGQLVAFCAANQVDAADCLMVGDSLHDLHAGRAAGMRTVGVLTGPARREEMSADADVVLDSIAELPEWIKNTT